MNVNPSIFKTYDIRGIWKKDLSVEFAEAIGRAFVTYVKPKRVVAGRDVRTSSPELFAGLRDAIVRTGVDVTDVGIVTSDALYFAVGKYGFDGGVVVTASHNPPEWNGFKLLGKGVVPLYGDKGIRQIKEIIERDAYGERARTAGKATQFDIVPDYVNHILSFASARPGRKLNVIIDCGNGAAARFVPDIMDRLPYTWEGMNMELDGTFPGRDPNPIAEGALDGLRQRVVKTRADLGVAFDPDADRMFFMDERGNRVFGDVLTALLAKHFLKQNPGAAIVYNLISSHIVPEEILKAGGRPIRTQVGHAYIKAAMREHDAVFGGEISGHFFFRDHFYADSGLIAMVVGFDMLSHQEEPLSKLVKDIDVYAHTAEVNVNVEDIPGTIAHVKQAFADGKIDELDGLTVEYPDWWFNVRGSNTEPLLRVSVEAKTVPEMERHKEELLRLIRGD